jgi:transposase
LLDICGCATLTAAKIIGETADVRRFRSRHAFARHNGTAPLPVWSSNKPRHRLSRTGNRQLNAAIHRIAITQAHYHEPARQLSIAAARAATTKPNHFASSSADYQTSSIEPCYRAPSTPQALFLSPRS